MKQCVLCCFARHNNLISCDRETDKNRKRGMRSRSSDFPLSLSHASHAACFTQNDSREMKFKLWSCVSVYVWYIQRAYRPSGLRCWWTAGWAGEVVAGTWCWWCWCSCCCLKGFCSVYVWLASCSSSLSLLTFSSFWSSLTVFKRFTSLLFFFAGEFQSEFIPSKQTNKQTTDTTTRDVAPDEK